MLAAIKIHLGEQGWSIVALVTTGVAIAFLPFLMRGGGRLRRRGTWRSEFRVRTGPSPAVGLALALVRRADTLTLASATIAALVLLVLNARA